MGRRCDVTQAVRLARSAVSIPLEDVAAAADVPRLADELTGLGHRGRCDAAAAAASGRGVEAALVHRLCPPGAVRSAAAHAEGLVIAGTAGWRVGASVSHRSARTAGVARVAAGSPLSETRLEAAGWLDLPPAVAVGLSGDDDWSVREQIAENRGCDLFALTIVACDQTQEVRVAVAANPSVPRRALKRLLGDDSWDVRGPAAANPVWGRTKSEQLLKDIYPDITRRGIEFLFLSERAASMLDEMADKSFDPSKLEDNAQAETFNGLVAAKLARRSPSRHSGYLRGPKLMEVLAGMWRMRQRKRLRRMRQRKRRAKQR